MRNLRKSPADKCRHEREPKRRSRNCGLVKTDPLHTVCISVVAVFARYIFAFSKIDALQSAPVALVRVVGQVEVFATLGFGHFYLREPLRLREAAGLLLVGAGVALALVGSLGH